MSLSAGSAGGSSATPRVDDVTFECGAEGDGGGIAGELAQRPLRHLLRRHALRRRLAAGQPGEVAFGSRTSPIARENVRFLIFVSGGWLTMPRTLGILALLAVLLQAGAAGAACDAQMAQCARLGQNFCGHGDEVACQFQCCPLDWTGCCMFQANGRDQTQCCPGPPAWDGEGETCVSSTGTCCPNSEVCGDNCCVPPLMCTPDESCCTAGNECGTGCCSNGFCCDGVCCKASEGKTCFDDGSVALCCPTTSPPCGSACCPPNQKCRRQHKPPDCKCKKKVKGPKCGTFPCPKHPKRKCGGTRCCEGDQCIDGGCVPPLG
jgi:hypothetical protein